MFIWLTYICVCKLRAEEMGYKQKLIDMICYFVAFITII